MCTTWNTAIKEMEKVVAHFDSVGSHRDLHPNHALAWLVQGEREST